MHDAGRVRVGDRLARLQHPPDRLGHRQLLAAFDLVRQVPALEELHHHVGRAVLELRHVHHAHDVLALDLRCRTCLTRETSDHLRVCRRHREQELDRDPLLELQVRGLNHDPHAARPQHAFDTVLPGQDLAFAHGDGFDGDHARSAARSDAAHGKAMLPACASIVTRIVPARERRRSLGLHWIVTPVVARAYRQPPATSTPSAFISSFG